MSDKDRNYYCIRPACGAPLSLYTAGGRKKNAFRLAEQKYCTDVCARKHYHEMVHEEQRLMEAAQAAMDKFIYSGPRNGKITEKPAAR